MLAALLQSLENIIYPAGVVVAIDIIENNTEKELAAVIQKASDKIEIEVSHHWVSTLGIPIARNAALKIAKESDATHIIFIDDDERVDPSWLTNLWQTYLTFEENSIIQGAVISSIQTTKNKHLHDQFQRVLKTTGERLKFCATNNVIIQLKTLEAHHLTFDESRPLAGGTDSKLFREAYRIGLPMIYCAEAIVYEDIPEERVRIGWLSKRNFRVGLTHGQYQEKSGAKFEFPRARTWAAIRDSVKALRYLIKGNRRKFDNTWLKACRNTGKALGFFNLTIDSYRKIDGN